MMLKILVKRLQKKDNNKGDVKDKIHWTIKEMVFFKLLQLGEYSLMRQANKGIIDKSYVSPEEEWRWVFSKDMVLCTLARAKKGGNTGLR